MNGLMVVKLSMSEEVDIPYLGLVQVYLGLWQRWRLQHLQEEAHDLAHVILQTLKSCIQSIK